jgi:FkbM family methyltransferase
MAPTLLKTLTTRHGTMLAFPNDRFLTPCLEVYGEYSPAETRVLEQIAKPGMTVVEVGSNIGAHTLPLARACRPGLLYAFEPQRRVFQVLCANLALNDIDNVVALQQACGAEAGEVAVPPLDYAARENFGAISMLPAEAAGEHVPLVRLDDLNLQTCGLIKIDAEGFELDVLAGAAATIARTRPVLYVENDRPHYQRTLVQMIAMLGYRLHWHTPRMVTSGNFKGETRQVFNADYKSLNMLCLPRESGARTDLEPIDPNDPRMPADIDPARPPVGGA